MSDQKQAYGQIHDRDLQHHQRPVEPKPRYESSRRELSSWPATGSQAEGHILAYKTGGTVMSNQAIERKPNGTWAKGASGNLGGNAQRTRHLFSKAFVEALLEDFREWGAEAIVRVRTETPAAYLRVCAMLVPKELKLEHSQAVKALSDEQIEQAIEAIQTMLAARAGEASKVLEGTAKPAALPAPEAQSIGAGLEPKCQRRPNRLLMQADTAVGPRQRISRRVPPPSRA
jgi:hypothetical protein